MNDEEHKQSRRFVWRPMWGLIFTIVIGATTGTVVGWLLFQLTTLSGAMLSIAVGAIAGGAVAAGMIANRRRRAAFILETVTVSVPHFSEMKFVVNRFHREVAWRLFVESMTRVSTQPLDPHGGRLDEALNSLYQLFVTTRELLKEMQPTQNDKGTSVELLAMRMLNVELRPFLTKWHTRPPDEGEGARDIDLGRRDEFRAELDLLRQSLLEYSKAFGELAHVRQIERFYASED